MRINTAPLSDNLTDVLTRIYEFTARRHRLLMANVANASNPGYMPMDLPVEEFAAIMDLAVSEHTRSNRLLFCDSKNVKFGSAGLCDTLPLTDLHASRLLAESKDEYLEYQLTKLSENTLNQKIAAELLKHKQGILNIPTTIKL